MDRRGACPPQDTEVCGGSLTAARAQCAPMREEIEHVDLRELHVRKSREAIKHASRYCSRFDRVASIRNGFFGVFAPQSDKPIEARSARRCEKRSNTSIFVNGTYGNRVKR